ncbi:membrane protein insertase YidC [Sphingobacterium sp. SRCM116780]|uniref:membrane protein insertase YidC n=1 Tax=Sphingobacterium sp. SRCM116780 TaxID=2907623 RepID=UPI001F1D6EED|nr:membrane protein insertase YidC [Sphingobacterium sp. SRCM116780]UIR54950.1 membrane protein insertase YidC [Sphingobacterium sp. SRCM116780]
MDRNTLIGLLLMFGIIAGSFYLMKPSDVEIKKEQALQDSLARVKKGLAPLTDSTKTNGQIVTTQPAQTADSATLKLPFGATKFGTEKIITLENDKIIAKISSKGGRVKSVQLKGETNFNGKPLLLFEGDDNKFGLKFNVAGQAINTNDLYFTSEDADVKITGEDSKSIKLKLNYGADQYIEYVYTLKGHGYNLGLDINTKGIQNKIDQKSIDLDWETILLQKEQNIASERQKSTIYYKEGDNVDHLSEAKDEEKELKEKVVWIAFKQHYFSNILSSKTGFTSTKVDVKSTKEEGVIKLYSSTAQLDYATQRDNNYSLSFFFGPNQYKTLKAEGHDFHKIINMGWGPMRWINQFITVPVFDFLDGFNMSYGIVILILTLLLKLVLSPLTYKSYLSMAKMRVLKPQLDEIKAKVGEDNAVLLQQEQMKLYKTAGVNPLGGCLPLVLQMPFTIAFFYFFPNLFELRGESFLFMKDMSTYDTLFSFAPIFGVLNHVSLMCVLMTLTTLLTTWYNNSTSGATGQMKYIGYIMPLIFFFVLNSFPAGLNYYYFLSAILTFLTQLIIRSMVNDDKILAKLESNKKNPKVQKKSTFQSRMEEAMRQAQQNKK